MEEDELAACRKQNEELRAKLCRLVPEWKNLKTLVQKLTASEAAAVARAEQLAKASDISSPSSTSSGSDDAAALRAKLGKLVPEWKRLKEANKSLSESESTYRLKAQELESQLDAANVELERTQGSLQEVQERVLELSEAANRAQELESELKAAQEVQERVFELSKAANRAQELESELKAANADLEKLREDSYTFQELQSRLNSAHLELEEATRINQEYKAKLDAAYIELEQLPEAIRKAQQLQLRLETANSELERLQEDARDAQQYSAVVSRLQNQFEQQDEEISRLRNRLEKAMQRPSKLDYQKLKHENVQLQKMFSVEADIVRALQNDIAESRSSNDKVVSLSDELADLKARFSVCQASRDSLIIDGDKLEAENRMLHLQIDQLRQSNPEELNEIRESCKDSLSEGKSLFSGNQVESDSDKFHHYQNRIETLEEELLELTASNAHLQQMLSFMNSELLSSQEFIQQSSSYLRSESDLLLQSLSEKEQLIEDLSYQLNGLRAHYGEKMVALKATIYGLRRHNDRLQEIINAHEYNSEGEVLRSENVRSPERMRETEKQVDRQSDIVDSDMSLKLELEAAQIRISEQTLALHDAQMQIDDLRRELESLQTSTDEQLKFDFEDAKIRVDDQSRQLQDAHSQISELRQELEETESRNQLDLEEAKLRIDEQSRHLTDALTLNDELRQELESAQLRVGEENQADEEDAKIRAEQNRELEVAQLQISELRQELQAAQARINEQNLELRAVQSRIDEQTCELESAQAKIDEVRRDLVAAQSRIEEQNRELEATHSQFDEQRLMLESARNQVDQQRRNFEAAEAQIVELCQELEAVQIRLEEQRCELESAQSQIAQQTHGLNVAQKRIDQQSQLGRAIVHSYNELRGHYELLMAKVESESAAFEQILRSQSSRSLSPRKSAPFSINEVSASKPSDPVRSASVPAKKRRTLKELLVKLFERPIYDENGKPISRVDLTEDTTFAWDPVKKKYIDLNAPEVEEKSTPKPPPRPSFALSHAPPASVPPGTAPPPRMPNRSLTGSRYALPEGQSGTKTPPKPSSSVGSRYALVSGTSENPPKPSAAISVSAPSPATVSSSNSFYSPPVINSFEDVVIISADYHSLVASLLALQKELACTKRARLETDVHVSTLVRQIKDRLAKTPMEPKASDSMEVSKLIYCILAITGIVSALTQISA